MSASSSTTRIRGRGSIACDEPCAACAGTADLTFPPGARDRARSTRTRRRRRERHGPTPNRRAGSRSLARWPGPGRTRYPAPVGVRAADEPLEDARAQGRRDARAMVTDRQLPARRLAGATRTTTSVPGLVNLTALPSRFSTTSCSRRGSAWMRPSAGASTTSATSRAWAWGRSWATVSRTRAGSATGRCSSVSIPASSRADQQQILDHPAQPFRVAAHDLQPLADGLRPRRIIGQQEFRSAGYRREGGAPARARHEPRIRCAAGRRTAAARPAAQRRGAPAAPDPAGAGAAVGAPAGRRVVEQPQPAEVLPLRADRHDLHIEPGPRP